MLKEVKTSGYEPFYTLTEAEKIIDLQRAKDSRRKVRLHTYFIKQKICGAVMVILSCLIPIIDNEAGMAAVICFAVGIGLVITKQHVMTFWR